MASGAAAAATMARRPARAATGARTIKAVAFDAFPVLDPRPIAALAEKLFPGKGEALVGAWRTRQFEYQWLRTLAGHFSDFLETTESSLVFTAGLQKLDLTGEKRDALMQAHLELRPWPDAPAALRSLQQSGLRLAFLSNMTRTMLENGIRNGNLEGLFEHVLSTDRVRAHKPHPSAYRMGPEAFGLEVGEIAFASFAGWDTAGAVWFGYPTFWVNRLGVPPEELGVVAHASGRNLPDLVAHIESQRPAATRTSAA